MRILIIGYGVTGHSLKEYFDKYQNEVFIYDKNFIEDKNYYSYDMLVKEKPLFDLGIKSPGIRMSEELNLVMSLCREVESEIDYAYSHLEKAHIIGITGSNGKTSLATFLYHFLSLKNRVFLVGNIGKPLIEIVDEVKKNDYVVLELSSFQISDSKMLKLDELFVTSLSPNHLNIYDSLSHYYVDKKRVFLLLNEFGNYYTLNDSHQLLNVKRNNYEISNDFSSIIKKKIVGKYFIEYVNIAMNYCYRLGYKELELINLLSTLKMVNFRLSKVYASEYLIFINDSKSTTSSSSKYCYETFYDLKRYLILGGIHKSSSFSSIDVRIGDEVLIYGRDRNVICNEISGRIFLSLKEIMLYLKSVEERAYVLFSPGCDSHDIFKSYIDRGMYFNSLVKEVFDE